MRNIQVNSKFDIGDTVKFNNQLGIIENIVINVYKDKTTIRYIVISCRRFVVNEDKIEKI